MSRLLSLAAVMVFLTIFASPAYALCSINTEGNPGEAGEIDYFSADTMLRYCDGTNWYDMEYDPLALNSNVDFKFDEVSGTTIFDSSGNANNGTMVGGLNATNDSVTGVFGNALKFDGVDDYATIPASASINDLHYDDFSVSAWIKINGHTTNSGDTNWRARIASKRDFTGSTNKGWIWSISDDKALRFIVLGTSSYPISESAVNSLTVGTVHHVVATYDSSAGKIRLYIDGTEVTYVTQDIVPGVTPESDAAAPLIIGDGQDTINHHFNGVIDNFHINNTLLTPDMILANYNTAANLNLVAHYKLDETSGTIAYDSSGNGLNGTMFGTLSGTDTVAGKVRTALDFSDNNDYLTVPDDPLLDVGTGDFTLSAWHKLDYTGSSGVGEAIVGKGQTGSGGIRYGIFINENDDCGAYDRYKFEIDDNSTKKFVCSDSKELLSWNHVALVKDATSLTGYVNGTLVGTTTLSSYGNLNNNTAFSIGSIGSDFSTLQGKGVIDDVRLYKKALNDNDIVKLAACPSASGTYFFNTKDETMQWCNGINTVANMGKANEPADSGAVCTGNIPYGSLYYITDTYYYCIGTQAIPIGRSCVSCGGDAAEKVAFVTVNGQTGDFGGIAAADAVCQAEADSEGLLGTYKAWLSDTDPTSAPATRFSAELKGTLPIKRTDGITLANNWTDLTDGNIQQQFNYNKYGAENESGVNFSWTNVATDGTQKSSLASSTCNNWSTLSGAVDGGSGANTAKNSNWTDNSTTLGCNRSQRLYCFEQ